MPNVTEQLAEIIVSVGALAAGTYLFVHGGHEVGTALLTAVIGRWLLGRSVSAS